MSRAQQIENIIVGSLVCDFTEHWPAVRCCITEEMMQDEFNRKIFKRIKDLSSNKESINVTTVARGFSVEELSKLFTLTNDYDFNTKKWEYNEAAYLYGGSYTTVSFDDYISTFIKNYGRG